MKKSKAAKVSPVSFLAEFERQFVRPKEGRTLIVGSQVYGGKEDRRLRYADVVGLDMLDGPGVDLVLDLEEPLPDGIGQFDHIECMSVLEHSRRPWLLAANLERLLADGGTIYVTTPWIWKYHPYDHDYYRFSRDAFRALFENIEWEHLQYAAECLRTDDRTARVVVNNHPYMSRTETVGFGRRLPRQFNPPSDDAE